MTASTVRPQLMQQSTLLIVFVAALAGCAGFGRSRVAPEELAKSGRAPVRIETTDGEKIVLWDIRIVGDSLVGERTEDRNGDWVVVDPRVAIPLHAIDAVETWLDNTAGILVFVGILVGGLLALGYLATQIVGS